jgi:hypothetical protein
MLTQLTRPGVWIWLMAVMVLSGTGLTAVLLLSPQGQDLTLLRLALVFAVSGVVAVPVARSVSKTLMAPAT